MLTDDLWDRVGVVVKIMELERSGKKRKKDWRRKLWKEHIKKDL